MPCPAELYNGRRDNNRHWQNWLGNISYLVPSYFQPSTLPDLVWILQQAELEGRKVKAVGRGWSFEDCAVSDDWVVDICQLNNTITFLTDPATGPAILAPGWRARQTGASTEKLYHVEAGIRIIDLNERLADKGLAMLTLGGSQGQTLAGAISTSTHGSTLDHPPLPGVIQAVHLITTGGQEVWIESASEPVTAADEPLRAQLACPDLQIIRDDALLRAAQVTIGRFGVIYAYVIKVTQSYRLSEWTEELSWPSVSNALVAGVGQGNEVPVRGHLGGLAGLLSDPPAGLEISTGVGDFYFLEIILNSNVKARHGDEVCWVRRRWLTDNADDLNLDASQNRLCHHGVANLLLIATVEVLETYANAILAIPIYGGFKFGQITAHANALKGHALDPHITGGDALTKCVNAVWDSQIGEELEWLVAELNHIILHKGLKASNPDGIRGPGWQVLAGVDEGTTGECYRANSTELIFSTETSAYVDFVNRLLEAADDFHMGGYISIRFSSRSDAYLSMHNVSTPLAVSIEVSSIYDLEDSSRWIAFAERTGREMGGRSHWGQQNRMSAVDLITLYDPTAVREWKEQCLRMVGPFSTTFSNSYTRQRGLEPFAVSRPVTHTRKKNGTVTHLCAPGAWWSPVPIDEAIRHTATGVCRYQTLPAEPGVPNAPLRLRRYLTTPAGGGREDNLDFLPRCGVGALAPPPDRRRLRITSVVQGGGPFTVIQLICNDDEGWGVHVLDAYQQIATGRREFYVVDPRTGAERPVLIRQYLSTDVDPFAANNLDNLPEC
ncbi:MAG: FAD-binding protein [Chloroflexota bacterium]|nr:MAG: FAD-binding protein [Chloroflexota bacterium]